MDIGNMVWSQLTSDLLSILRGFSDVSQEHHPERLKTMYIIHAPKLFSMAWALISPFVPQATKEKIKILSWGATKSDPFLSVYLPNIDPSKRNHFDPPPSRRGGGDGGETVVVALSTSST